MGIWLVRTIAVWLVTGAWWQCAYTVLKLNVNVRCILLLLFLFSGILNALFAGSHRKYIMPVSLAGVAVAAVLTVLWKKDIFAATVNHIANAYLKLGVSDGAGVLLYNEAGASALQRSVITAAFFFPLIIIFTVVLWYGRGKLPAVILTALPILLPTLKARFPDSYACWLMISAAAVYFSIVGIKSGKAAWGRAAVVSAVLLPLLLIAVGVGNRLDVKRKESGSSYYKVRAVVQETIVDRVEAMVKPKEDGGKEKKKEEKEHEEKTPQEPQEQNQVQNIPVQLPWDEAQSDDGQSAAQDSSAKYLGDVASFSPDGSLNVVVEQDKRPESTVYYPLWYGGYYSGNIWEKLPLGDAVLDQYLQFPMGIPRLIALCKNNLCRTPQEASAFIDKEFKENTVYDYEPGETPWDKDFAEYFLFDNKKGFCVHFATTATLMYRIYGITARYAEGYAIPAEAFEEQESGRYIAHVTGEMGHAWCEVYENGWNVKEHTLSYTGPEQKERGPAADVEGTLLTPFAVKVLVLTIIILAALILLSAGVIVQAAVRRKKRERSYCRGPIENSIQNIYRNIYETAVFLGMDRIEPLKSQTLIMMEDYCIGITHEELLWLKETVQEIIFNDKIPSKEELGKAGRIHKKFVISTKKKLIGLQRMKYRYFRCLG